MQTLCLEQAREERWLFENLFAICNNNKHTSQFIFATEHKNVDAYLLIKSKPTCNADCDY